MLNRWKYRILLAAALLIVVALTVRGVLGVAWQRISVGPDTTKITGPLRTDGTVDYIAALNEKYGRGATRENNACLDQITLFARFGPDAGSGTAAPSPPGAFSFGLLPVHFDPALRDANRWTDRLVAAGSQKTFAAREASLLAVDADVKSAEASLGKTSQAALERLAMLFIDHDLRGPFRIRDYAVQALQLTQDALDAREYFAVHPHTPAAVQEWAKGLPPDLFAEKPVKVTLAGNLLTLACDGPAPLPPLAFPATMHIKPTPRKRHDFRIDVRLP